MRGNKPEWLKVKLPNKMLRLKVMLPQSKLRLHYKMLYLLKIKMEDQ